MQRGILYLTIVEASGQIEGFIDGIDFEQFQLFLLSVYLTVLSMV